MNLQSDFENWNPGPVTYEWYDEDQGFTPILTTERVVDLFKSHEQLYLVKWKNLSYLHATWEFITGFANSQGKLFEFR